MEYASLSMIGVYLRILYNIPNHTSQIIKLTSFLYLTLLFLVVFHLFLIVRR